MLAGAGLLTYLALREDRHDTMYQVAVKSAERDAERVRVLANSPEGISPVGAVALLREDPFTQGPKLFAQKCAGCHRYDGDDGLGGHPQSPQSASDLKGFASRDWLAGLGSVVVEEPVASPPAGSAAETAGVGGPVLSWALMRPLGQSESALLRQAARL